MRRSDAHWRHDLLSSTDSPVQYFAVAQRGRGADAEDILVIAIECLYDDERPGQLVVTASISKENGAILAEAEPAIIEVHNLAANGSDLGDVATVTRKIQRAFDRMVDWVNDQSETIHRALA